MGVSFVNLQEYTNYLNLKREGFVMDDHNLNEEQFNKWKQLVEIMGRGGNVAMYNWVMSHLNNENGLTVDLEDYQQVG